MKHQVLAVIDEYGEIAWKRPAVEVPWCDQHDQPMHPQTSRRTCNEGWAQGCRLEEPARHYKIGPE